MLSVVYAECHMQVLLDDCHYAKWHPGGCCHAECRGAEKTEVNLLNKSSCLAAALGMTKFRAHNAIN